MIVSVGYPVIAARPVAETDLGNVPGLPQVPQRVIDGRKTNARQQSLPRRKPH